MPAPSRPPTAQEFTDLREGIDYTWEGASVVLTESYLRSLGRCCQSGCRNCPWNFRRRPVGRTRRDPQEQPTNRMEEGQ